MKIFYILSLICLFAIKARSQSSMNTGADLKYVKLYPNPATTQITFSFENGYDKNYSFQIFNFIGKKVYDLPSLAPKMMVDLTQFYRGVYIFQVKDKGGKIIESGKFQVAH